MPITALYSLAKKPIDVDAAARNAYALAVQLLGAAFEMVRGDTMNEQQRTWFKHFFVQPEITEVGRAAVAERLIATLKGIEEREITIYIDALMNYAHKKPTVNTISIRRDCYANAAKCVRYLIHETSHLYAETTDDGDAGYVNDDAQFRAPGLTGIRALGNADSLACFALLASGEALK